MMHEIDTEMRVIDLTVGELMTLLSNRSEAHSAKGNSEKQLVYGMSGIASVFNCSLATAHRIKKSGVIDEAISQRGRTIVCDATLALQLFHKQ